MQAQCFHADAPAEVIMQAEYGVWRAVLPGGYDKFCHSAKPYAALGYSELLILAVVEFAQK